MFTVQRSYRRFRQVAAAIALAFLALVMSADIGAAAPARVNGQGSSYVALAMQQWVADAQTTGLQVNYLPTGSPQGLTSYGQSLAAFAGTDVARMFMGDITRWNDPAISADNRGLVLPDQPITIVYRGGQSGTTGLFYDFVANVAPDLFGPWAARNRFPTSVRIIQLDSSPGFVPKSQAFQGSDQIAQFIASGQGLWSVGYDEFGYSKVYNAPSAWIENAAGEWILPYAENISAALEDARLRPDLSQELSGVYNSGNPKAYPISAYSYIVTQCVPSPDRPTCKGPYSNPGVTETLALWLRYIACDGQVNMAKIGYSPLPPNLSQEVANSISRLTGQPAEQLSAANCANPRFSGSVGEGGGSPPDPLAGITSIGDVAGGIGATTTDVTGAGAAGGAGATKSAGGGSTDWRKATPVAYTGPSIPTSNSLALVLLLFVMVIPLGFGIFRSRKKSGA